jgi:protein JSN1
LFLGNFFLKRMELQAEEQQRATAARYRPPALRALASGGLEDLSKDTNPSNIATLPPNNYSPGFRRARAGTLPSNVQLAAQNYAVTTNPLSRAPASSETLSEQLRQQSAAAAAASLNASVRPTLRHSATAAPIAGAVVSNERHSRLRSGSLTLPSAGLSNAFGPSLFASSWMSSNNGTGNGFPALDELRSVTSDSVEDFDVHTLDYLGLDDSLRQPPAATISELRNQAQAAIAGNLANPSSRLRANTVSNPYRVRGSNPNSLLGTPMAVEDEEEIFANYDNPSNYARPRINSINTYAPVNETNYDPYMTKNFKQNDLLTPPIPTSRPRAISVGNLDDPMRSMQRRTGGAEVQPSSYLNDLPSQNSGLTAAGLTGMYRTENIVNSRTSPNLLYSGNDNSQSRASAYLAAPGSQGRSVSPKQDNSQIQTPTRSLWIGNLDSAVTSEQLIHVFAPYGAIESLRLLPEKVFIFISGLFSCRSFLLSMKMQTCYLPDIFSSFCRNAALSTLWSRPTPSVPRKMFLTAWVATSVCPTAKLCVSVSARPIALQWRPLRARR